MGSNIREFVAALRVEADAIPERVETVHRVLHVEAGSRLVLRSPVDEGTFRGDWQFSVGAPPAGVLDVPDPSGAGAIARCEASANAIPAFAVSWLVNNQPYADRLANGWSRQAPAGWVEASVEEVRGIVPTGEGT